MTDAPAQKVKKPATAGTDITARAIAAYTTAKTMKDVEFMEISEWFQFSGIAVTERRCPQKIKSVVALRPMQGERKTPARKLVLGVV